MPPLAVFAVASSIAAWLLPSALALPFEHPSGRLPGDDLPAWPQTMEERKEIPLMNEHTLRADTPQTPTLLPSQRPLPHKLQESA